MRFTAPRAELARVLRLALSCADVKAKTPIFGMTCMRVTSRSKLTVASQDGAVSLLADVAIANGETGGMCVGADLLHRTVSPMSGDEVTIRAVDAKRVEIKCGRSRYDVVGVPDRDFPKVPALPEAAAWHDADAQDLVRSIAAVRAAVCRDETRFHLNGALFDNKDTDAVTLVTTDGHREHIAVTALPSSALASSFIVPTRGLHEIARLLDDATSCMVADGGGRLFVRVDGTTLAVRPVDAAFPPWRQVMPAHKGQGAEADRVELVDAIRRTGVMVDFDERKATRGVAFRFVKGSDTLSIEADHPDKGIAREEVTLVKEWTRSDLAIGLDPRILIEAINACGGDIARLSFGGDLDPLKAASADGKTTAVVMPMRL